MVTELLGPSGPARIRGKLMRVLFTVVPGITLVVAPPVVVVVAPPVVVVVAAGPEAKALGIFRKFWRALTALPAGAIFGLLTGAGVGFMVDIWKKL
jgi:hypothetical protein